MPNAGLLATAMLAALAAPADERPVVLTRADLARSYLRFEQALASDPAALTRDPLRLNERFDRASLAFFTGRFADSCRDLDLMALELEGRAADPVARFARSLVLHGLPPVIVAASESGPPPLSLRLAPMWRDETEAAGSRSPGFELVVAHRSAAALRLAVTFNADGHARIELAPDALPAVAGRLEVSLEWPGGRQPLASATVVRASLDGARETLLAALATTPAPTPELAAAHASITARAALLTDSPSPLASAQFLADPLTLLRDVHRELAALRAGRDPFIGRTGDLWRVLQAGDTAVPLRIHVPPAGAPAADAPLLPVVIALHGAGGDENMFMDGYGAGLLCRLADARRFVAVAPQTQLFTADPDHLARLLDELARHHPIDRSRVVVVGHSMGAGAAAAMARRHGAALAGVACIAGGAFPTAPAAAGSFARTRLVVGLRDPIVPAPPLLRSARAAQAAGLPITIEEHAEFGHTLLVTHTLPAVIDWLLGG